MGSRYEVELTITRGKDLKNINWKHGPLKPYAVVWVDPRSKSSSHVDEEGDTSPEWNETLRIPFNTPIDDEESTLHIDIVHAKAEDEDTKPLIGSATLPLRDVVDEAAGLGNIVQRKLKLKRPSGRPHGTLEVSVNVRELRYPPPGAYPAPAPSPAYGYAAPPSGYPYTTQPPPYGQAGAYGQPGYGQAPYPGQPGYEQAPYHGQPVYGQEVYGHQGGYGEEKKSKSGGMGMGMGMGMGTGLAVGAAAGLLGGLAISEGIDQLEDNIADDVADRVEDDYGYDDDE